MSMQRVAPGAGRLEAELCWERLRWDDEDWSEFTRNDVDMTIDALVIASAGQELRTITRLVDLIDEDIFSAGYNSVSLSEDTTAAARAVARGLDDDGHSR